MITVNFVQTALRRLQTTLLLLAFALGSSSTVFAAATIAIVNGDGAGVGFNDVTVVAPVGGNTGTTLGQQRLNAFQAAANKWGATLNSAATIRVLATWEALTCTETSAVLGSAGAIQIYSDFAGAPFPASWYGKALTAKLLGSDPDSSIADIRARFNRNLGQPGCLTGTFFYLGLDDNHGSNVDLVTVLTHEFSHGLGFQTFTNGSTGAPLQGTKSAFDRFLLDVSTGKSWFDMTDAERAASAVNAHKLTWNGPQVTTDVPNVLSSGTPVLKVNSPGNIAGNYDFGSAAFGPAVTTTGTTGDVVLALDPNDASGTSTTDGCSALTNGAAVSGKIAILDRGGCAFVIKVKNAQNAGAVAVLIADNVAGSPPAGLGGADATITIPSVRITLADGNMIKAQLGGGVNVTIKLDNTVRAGADPFGKALMYTPNPFQGGSSVSHWDSSAFPNQLMEPSINGDLTHNVAPPSDLTFSLMRDIGWVASTLPSTIVKTSGDNQHANMGQAFAAPMTVTTSPAVSGLTLTWTVNPNGSGAGATFPSTGSRTAVSTTNALGVATAPMLVANNIAGAHSMNANVPGAGTTTFTLTNDAAPLPDLTITKSHVGASFAQGQIGKTYTVTVTNIGTAVKADLANVSVTDTAPSGLTITAMSGAGWTCTALPTCTRTDPLAAAASYPAITVTVTVAPGATSPQVNSVAVSTAAVEANSGNNSGTDSTIIGAGTSGSLSVAKSGSGTGTVTSADGGINCGGTCTQTYVNGSAIRLTAGASGDSVFTGWLGACTGTGVCVVNVNGASTVQATFALSSVVGLRVLDIDANNAYEAANDGVLVLRHLFGMSGTALSNGATGAGSTPARVADPALRNYLVDITPYLDVDGNGRVEALTDGLLILRKLLRLTELTGFAQNAVGSGATRSPSQIETYIQTLKPP